MTFYQRIIFTITTLVTGVTVTGIFLFFANPLGEDTLYRMLPVLFAEIQCGLFMGAALREKTDFVFPFYLTHSVLDFCYLIFTVVMAFMSPAEIGIPLYIFIHLIVLLLLFGVIKLLMVAGVKNIREQTVNGNKSIKNKRTLFANMSHVLAIVQQNFATNRDLIKKCQKLCADFRFTGDVFCNCEEELNLMISQLQSAAELADEAGVSDLISKISIKVNDCLNHSVI
ncbi:MAG: hypothetical protein IJW23_02205 [Lentisphaeria bacterium]|nr:hypothetical protein [Lentisphaeria bacterium]